MGSVMGKGISAIRYDEVAAEIMKSTEGMVMVYLSVLRTLEQGIVDNCVTIVYHLK